MIGAGNLTFRNVEGEIWRGTSGVERIPAFASKAELWNEFGEKLAGNKGVDGAPDLLWTCHRGKQIFVFNPTDKVVVKKVDGQSVQVLPFTIWMNEAKQK